MTKMENKKESICFNFEKDKQKQIFFDKTKKCGIINNNNSVFLNKILSIKNQSLLNNNIKKYPSEIFKKINSSSDNKKQNNINNTNNTNRSFNRNNKANEFKQKSLTNLFEEMDINSPHIISNSNSNIFSPKLVSSKIIVNKNKNLGMSTHKERDKDRDKDKDKDKNKENEKIYLDTYFNKDNTNNKKIKQAKEKERHNLNNEFFLNPEISFSNLYTSKYIRKPVVIKFNNAINPININTNTNTSKIINNSYNSNNQQKIINFSMTMHDKEENKENNVDKERIKTDEPIKPYNFYEKSKLKSELYRSYEDLEKKSMEITRRKLKKNSSSKIENFKKDTNLEDVKESFDNFRNKSKSKILENDINDILDKKRNMINKNKSLKNVRTIKTKEIFLNSLIKEENEKNDFHINKKNLNFNNYWQEQRNIHYNNINDNENDNEININNINNINDMTNIKCENILYNEDINKNKKKGNYFIKKKNININFIENNKNENVYNISLNNNQLIFNNLNNYNNFNNSLKYNKHNLNEKHSFIRKKYGKKNNLNKIFEDCKIQFKNSRKENNRGNKTPIITKTFIEDYKMNDNNNISLSYSQSQSYILANNLEKHIKVNKKSNSSHKGIKRIINKNLPSILEEEEKIKNEIKNNLNTINGIEIINNLFNSRNKNILKDKFKLLIDYSTQMKSFSNSTLLTSISQNTGLRYIKKIIPINTINTKINKENPMSVNKHYLKANNSKKNFFDVEKQKLIILKRKEFGFFERYEHCIDLIDNLRTDLLKFIFNGRKNKKI